MKFTEALSAPLKRLFKQSDPLMERAQEYREKWGLPKKTPKRDLARYQRFDNYLSDLIVQMNSSRRYILDPSFSYTRDPDYHRKVWREPVIAKAIWTRATNVVGGDWYLEDADEESAPLTEVFKQLIGKCSRFQESLIHMAFAFFTGSEWCKIDPKFDAIDPLKMGSKDQWWFMQRLRPMDRSRFHLEFHDEEDRRYWEWAIGNPILARTEVIPPEEWHLYVRHVWLDWEHQYGYGWGIGDGMAVNWEIKQTLKRYLATGLERFAWPWIIVKTDEESEPVTASLGASHVTDRLVFEKIRKMRQAGILRMDTSDEITTLDMGTTGNQIILNAIDYIDKENVEYILGASAQVGGHGIQAQAGAYASDQVEADSSDAYMGYDRTVLDETCTEQVISRLSHFNQIPISRLGIAENGIPYSQMRPPKFHLGRKKRDDPMNALMEAQGIQQLGYKVDMGDLSERVGWKLEEDPMAGMGGMGMPGFGAMPQAGMPGEEQPQEGQEETENFFEARSKASAVQRFQALNMPARTGISNDELYRLFVGR